MLSRSTGAELMSKHNELLYWINDGLMVLFFFVVGLEIKREVVVGELASIRQALTGPDARRGGRYGGAGARSTSRFNRGDACDAKGWGVPMATDIAFALGASWRCWAAGCR